MKNTDTEKAREQKRKKVKALKLAHKKQVQEQGALMKKNEWQNFQKKGTKTSRGHFAFNKSQ